MYFDQSEYEIRMEWGLEGVRLLAPICDAVVIIDVISFTTSVDLALDRALQVFPCCWKDESALVFAASKGAIAAVGSRSDPQSYSLAPSSMLRLPKGARVVLPSPNGATLSLATGSTPTFCACLRNAPAVAGAASALGPRIGVIAAGERWPDGSLRPALEDQLGAGALIHHLPGLHSPEAQAAEAVFLRFREDLLAALLGCSSGKEAAARGSRLDVELAAQWDSSQAAPRLLDGAYGV
jgi:2-phosphosulfolactate phosphatase